MCRSSLAGEIHPTRLRIRLVKLSWVHTSSLVCELTVPVYCFGLTAVSCRKAGSLGHIPRKLIPFTCDVMYV